MNNSRTASTFGEIVNRCLDKALYGKPFLVTADATVTYGTFADQVLRLVSLFDRMSLKVGDRVVVSTDRDTAAASLIVSLAACGIAAVVVDPETKAMRARALINIAGPAAVFLDDGLQESWKLPKKIPVIRITREEAKKGILFEKLLGRKAASTPQKTDDYPAVLDELVPGTLPANIDPESDAFILFTSGTTSDSKGVQISHHSLVTHLGTLSRQFGYHPESRILNVLPLHHTDGLTHGIFVALMNQATIYRPTRFSIQQMTDLLDSIYRDRITHFVAVPTMLSLIERFGADYEDAFDTEDFECIISSAAYLEVNLWKQFERRFKTRVANMYGLTESVTGGLFCGPGEETRRIGTVGKPVDCQAKIVDENHAEVVDGETGELLLKGDNIMKGYLNAPHETEKVLRDGWFHTGDLATRDSDGFYWIVGRKKTLIITGGINVHPEEVTETLNAVPGVVEAVAFGIEDETWGERVAAAIVPDKAAKLTESDMIEHCRKHLEPAKIPNRLFFLPSLPKGPAGKVLLEEIRRMAVGEPDGKNRFASDNLRSEVFAVASEVFRVPAEDLKPSSGPDDTAGWDSLAHMEFVAGLEKSFSVRLSTSEIMKIERLSDAEAVIASRLTTNAPR